MNLGALREAFARHVGEVDAALAAYLATKSTPESHYGLVRYHLGFADESLQPLQGDWLARGKRLRAIFSMLICQAVGASPAAARALMVAGELMHNASLVHDDIQDDSPIRWGRPTIWRRFGVHQAINVGDALIFMVYEQLLTLRGHGVSPQLVLKVLEVFNSGQLRMAEGQHLDLEYEGRMDIGLDRYLDVISRKTAAACECIAHSSALLSDPSPAVEERYRAFGHSYGMLYQVCDDVKAIWGDPEDTGKQALGDLRLRKSTLPVIYGVERGPAALRDLLLRPIDEAPEYTDEEAETVRRGLDELGVRELCQARAAEYRDEALANLRAVRTEAPAHDHLERMVLLTVAAAGMNE